MKVEVIVNDNQFKELKDDWNSLLSRSKSYSIFLTWEWLYYWWLHFKGNKELFIILIKNESNGQILGILPCCIQIDKFINFIPIKKIKFLGTEKVASDFLDFIIFPGFEQLVIKSVFEYMDMVKDRWDMIEIGEIEKYSNSIGIVKKTVRGKFRLLEQKAQTCPYIKLPENFELLLSSLNLKMRSNVKRRMKLIEATNEAKLLLINKKEQLRRNIDTLFDLHNRRFEKKHNGKNLKSAFCGNEIKHFHYEIAEQFLLNDWLRFYLLELENKPIAALYNFRYKDRLYNYQSGIDSRLNNWGLGTVLISFCLNSGISEGLKEFNFLRGNEEYKYRWSKCYKETVNILIVNKTFPAIISYQYLKIKKLVRMILRKNKNG